MTAPALTALLALFATGAVAQTAFAAGWKAGVAKAVITPTTPMWMAGYGSRDRPAEGKHSDLFVRAVALEDPTGRRALVVSLEVCGIDRPFSERVRDRLRDEHQLGREAVVLSCTHTHSGPVVGDNLRGMNLLSPEQQRYVAEYTAGLEEQVVATAGEAIASLAPAKLAWTIGRATFAVNRRNNPEGKVAALREKGELKGPVDHDLPVMTLTSAGPEAKLLAIVYGYACHATTTALYEWSGDWPGVASAALERSHPGAVALCWIGCGGDQNPLPRRTYKHLAEYGAHASRAVEAAITSGPMKPIEPDATLRMSYSEIDLPFDTLPTRDELEADAESDQKYVANRAKLLLAQLDRTGRISPHYPYPVQVWRLGPEVKWVLLGGEVVVDYSLRLKRELGPAGTWVGSYMNDVMAYIPSRRVLAEGRYEGADSMVPYGQPARWAPEVEELIVKEVRRQADETTK